MKVEKKAQELLNKFALGGWRKEHAMSCVDEIVKELHDVEFNCDLNLPLELFQYWDNVKGKIEELSKFK